MPAMAGNARDADDIDALLTATLSAELASPPVDHPAVEQLVRYHLRDLDEYEAEALRDHLGRCRACTQAVLALVRSEAPEEKLASRPPPGAVDLAWDDLREHLLGVGATAPKPRPRWLRALAVAAVLGGAAVGLAMLWRGGDVEAVPNPHVFELFPDGGGIERGASNEERRVPSWAGALVVVLHSNIAQDHGEYDVAVMRDGRIVTTVEGLRPTASRELRFVLEVLPAGEYVAELRDRRSREPLERFPLSIEEPPPV